MEKTIYIRMRHRVQVRPHEAVFLKDLAQIIADDDIFAKLNNLLVHQIVDSDKNFVVIDVIQVIRQITNAFPGVEVQTIGPSQSIIEVIFKKKGVSIPSFLLVWFLLFFGAALTIMNFHEDVSMQAVHQRLFYIITGLEDETPLIFQVPYSLGLGLGMILFFNHLFKKRLNEEPSPLEVEMFNYQLDLDNYVVMHENKESVKKVNDY